MKVVAKYAYGAKRSDELSFQKKELLVVVDKKDDKGWWLAENGAGERGLVPSNYLLALPVEKASSEEPGAPEKTVSSSTEKTVSPSADAEKAKSLSAEKSGSPRSSSSASSSWEQRAVAAERALSELLSAVERDRLESDQLVAASEARVRQAEQYTREAEERALEAAAALQSALENRGGEIDGGHGGHGEEERIAELERELEMERNGHREAVARATELFDSYEGARHTVEQLQNQLADARRENDNVHAEMKELKRKTARMVALFNEQKNELEQKLKNSSSASSDVGQLEAQHLKDKHTIENLRDEIASLKESLKQHQQQQQQARVYEPAPLLPVAAPPPPPPPPPSSRPTKSSVVSSASSTGGPTCPKCKRSFSSYDDFYGHEPCPGASMLASIQGGVALKKTTPASPPSKPPPVEKKPGGQGSFAEMAAAIAKQRAERANYNPTPSKRDSTREQLDKKIFLIRNSLRDDE